MVVDVTLCSALTRDGEPQPKAPDEKGAMHVTRIGHFRKVSTRCPQPLETLEGAGAKRLVNVLHQLANARAREVPASHERPSHIGVGTLIYPHARIHVQFRLPHRWWRVPGSVTRGAKEVVRHQAWLICLILIRGKRFVWTVCKPLIRNISLKKKPATCNLQPETRNPKPETRNLQLENLKNMQNLKPGSWKT